MVAMKFCLQFPPDRPIPELAKLWRAADAAGIDTLTVSDSPLRVHEMYILATLCAREAAQARILTCVTNPVTRHPSVAASALLSLNELAPGRIAFGIATGDSALWGVGLKSATVARLREYILAMKALLRGESATWQGTTFAGAWSDWQPINIPVYVACSGPKTLRMAAQVADGLILAMGFAPEDIDHIRGIIDDACAEIGRDPNSLDLWWNADVTFAPSIAEASEASLGWGVSWLTMGSLEGKRIPERYKAALLELNADTHNLTAVYRTPGRGRLMVERAKRAGLYDWLVSRSPRLWGTPEDVSRRLAELADMGLANWIFFTGRTEDKFGLIDKLTHEVMPALRDARLSS